MKKKMKTNENKKKAIKWESQYIHWNLGCLSDISKKRNAFLFFRALFYFERETVLSGWRSRSSCLSLSVFFKLKETDFPLYFHSKSCLQRSAFVIFQISLMLYTFLTPFISSQTFLSCFLFLSSFSCFLMTSAFFLSLFSIATCILISCYLSISVRTVRSVIIDFSLSANLFSSFSQVGVREESASVERWWEWVSCCFHFPK